MALKLYEFQEKILYDIFLMKLDQFEQNGSIGILFSCWEIWKLKSTFEIKSRSRFSWALQFRCSIVELTFLSTKDMK